MNVALQFEDNEVAIL